MIRRDIYSVKSGNCHVFMTYNRAKAVRRLREEFGSKIVHPAQWVVDAYVAHNGPIAGRRTGDSRA